MVDGLARWLGRALVYRAPDEDEQCPACASPRLTALAVHKLARPVRGRRTGLVSGCADCGLVFVNPTPSDDDLASHYAPDGEWATGRTGEARSSKPPSAKPGSGSWVTLFDGARGELDVTRPPAGARVLDFGCGSGKFLDVLKACGWETYGIEPAVDSAFPRHRRLTAVQAEPTFDLVIAHHVLEHMSHPLAALRQFAAAARQGSFLLVATPRFDTLPVHRDFDYVISRVHVTAYTRTCMEGLLARAGWQPLPSPHDDVTISGGRRTAARLRVLARRVGETAVPLPSRPLDSARAALRGYDGGGSKRAALERLGAVRLAARIADTRRRLRKVGRRLRAVAPVAAGYGTPATKAQRDKVDRNHEG
jgi:SAM-dependent methyltransferase